MAGEALGLHPVGVQGHGELPGREGRRRARHARHSRHQVEARDLDVDQRRLDQLPAVVDPGRHVDRRPGLRRPGNSLPGQPRAVAVAATLLLLGAACRVDGGTASADAAPTDGAACVVRPPPSRYAAWPMPDSRSADPARAPSYDLTTAGVVVDRVTGLAWQRAVDAGPYTRQQAAAPCACPPLGAPRDCGLR